MSLVRVVPSGSALAADVVGPDLSADLDDATVSAILDAWSANLVLRFRNQTLTDRHLERFSALLGALDRAPPYSAGVDFAPQSEFVTIISNVVVDGKAIGDLGNAEALWHTDMSYNDVPPMASALYALEVPPAGGDTGFCNMYMAYETLEEPLKKRVEGLRLKHDATRNSVGGQRSGYAEATDPRTAAGAIHPMVRTHPVTGRSALFLGRRRNAYIVGLDLAESEMLLDELWEHSTRPEFTWYQQWRVGDLILWDNRCTMHRRDEFDGSQRRIMHRTQIAGDRPVFKSIGTTG